MLYYSYKSLLPETFQTRYSNGNAQVNDSPPGDTDDGDVPPLADGRLSTSVETRHRPGKVRSSRSTVEKQRKSRF